MASQKDIPLCTVLIYHRVTPVEIYQKMEKKDLFISENVFCKQMKIIAKHFIPLSITVFKKYLTQNKSFPQNSVLITFDDGYYDNYQFAYPIMKKLNIPFILFVTTGFIEEKNTTKSSNEKCFLDWNDLKIMLAWTGFSIGIHTLTHPDLSRLSKKEADDEIIKPKQIIKEKLGIDSDAFAIPYGKSHHYNSDNLQTIQRYYSLCFANNRGYINQNNISKNYEIPRITPTQNVLSFKRKVENSQNKMINIYYRILDKVYRFLNDKN